MSPLAWPEESRATGWALTAVWEQMLSGVGTTIGRLAGIAGSRDAQTRTYFNLAVSQRVGLREADVAIRVCHGLVWRDWQLLSQERQTADLLFHFHDLAGDVLLVMRRWRDSKPYSTFPPDTISDEEGREFRNSVAGLITRLYDQHSADEHSTHAPSVDRDGRVRRVLSVVNDRYTDSQFSLAMLSKATNISERHLARLLKENGGTSFCRLLRRTRVERAAELLEGSAQPIKTIASLVGYGDWSHFGRDFRACMGCTPGEFRTKKMAGRFSAA